MLEDWRTAPVDEKIRVTLGFLQKLTLSPDEVSVEDIRTLRKAGVRDEAILDAIYVCVVFSVAVRLADAFGFEVPSEERMTGGPTQMLYGSRNNQDQYGF